MKPLPVAVRVLVAVAGLALAAALAVGFLFLPGWMSPRGATPESSEVPWASGPGAATWTPGFDPGGTELRLPPGSSIREPHFSIERSTSGRDPAVPPEDPGRVRLRLTAVRKEPGGAMVEIGRTEKEMLAGGSASFLIRTGPPEEGGQWLDVELIASEVREDFLTLDTVLRSASGGGDAAHPSQESGGQLLYPGDVLLLVLSGADVRINASW